MGRADASVAVVDWATLTGRDARWEGVVPCEAMYRSRSLCTGQSNCGDAVMAACLVVLGWSLVWLGGLAELQTDRSTCDGRRLLVRWTRGHQN